MARRSKVSMQKRQREMHKAEKAAEKRSKRHGLPLDSLPERRRPIIISEELARMGLANAITKSVDLVQPTSAPTQQKSAPAKPAQPEPNH